MSFRDTNTFGRWLSLTAVESDDMATTSHGARAQEYAGRWSELDAAIDA